MSKSQRIFGTSQASRAMVEQGRSDLTPCRFQLNGEGTVFDGYTDGSTWNGWANVWADEAEHLRLLGTLAREAAREYAAHKGIVLDDLITQEARGYAQWLSDYLSGLEAETPDSHGRYCYGGGYTMTLVRAGRRAGK